MEGARDTEIQEVSDVRLWVERDTGIQGARDERLWRGEEH
jgi:hypothetical protein